MSAHPPVMDVLPRHAIPKEPPRVKVTAKEPKKTQDTNEIQDGKETKESKDDAPSGIDEGAKTVDNDKAADGDQTDLATVLRRMTDLEKKLREMEESVKKVTDDNSSVNEDLDDIEPFGSASTVKIIPFMSPKKINLSANEPGIRKHAIVAQYEVPPSWKGDLAKLNASDVKGPPLNITINSAEIITLLKTVSGTTMKAEPCVMLPPYKVLVTHWDDILEKLKTFEDEYREAYGAESLDEIDSTEEKEPEKPEKPEKPENSEKASVLSKEESKKREEADEKRKNKREIVYTRCLVEFIRTFLKDIRDLRTTIRDRSIEKIRFDDLWHLYNPGDIVVNHEQGELRAYQVVSVTKGRRKMITPSPEERQSGDPHLRNSLRLQCYFMAYNGDVIDKQQTVKLIAPYEGEKRITDLDYCPFAFHQAASSAESEPSNSAKALVERGIRFLRYRHAQGSCDAMSLRPTEHVEGQVIVDFKSGYEEEFPKPELGSLKIAEYSSEETYESSCTLEGCTSCSNYIYADEQLDIKRAEGVLSKLHRTVPEAGIDELITKLEKKIEDAGDDISEDAVLQQALLLQHDFLIFSLRTKRWHFIDVKDFEPDTRTDKDCREGFDNLVIDKGHKRLLLAIVNDHAAARPVGNGKTPQRAGRSIDLTAGKGNGRIIFLYGPPGVGKTSTAETIAAYNKPARPLYPITCGDLGSTPTDIENNLTKHFKLAYRWNCVLLLDEADVYLAERHHSDLARNEIVSVFLRTLEYYSGLLFLTSNREGSIDQAFKSRIHLALHYKRIDGPGTQKIWRNMLTGIRKDNLRPDRAIKVEFDEDDLLDWAREHYSSLRSGRNEDDEGVPTWNGRQIRNAFHSALALASYDRSEAINKEGLTPEDALRKTRFRRIRLGREHFDDISSVVKVFERYLIQCGRGEQNAENECLRVDDFGNQQQPNESDSRGAGGSSRRQESRTRGTYARGPYDAASDEDDDYASDA